MKSDPEQIFPLCKHVKVDPSNKSGSKSKYQLQVVPFPVTER